MSISRRIFIRMASVATIAGGLAARPGLMALAEGFGEKTAAASIDPLAYYTQATFAQYVNSVFRLHGFITIDVTLEQVQDTLPAKVLRSDGRESFGLHFRGGTAQLPQDTYTVEHPALGTFNLFLVPSGADKKGAQAYVATINRLAYTAKPIGPRKPASKKNLLNTTPETKSPGSVDTTAETTPLQPPDSGGPKIQPPRKREPDRKLFPELDIQ